MYFTEPTVIAGDGGVSKDFVWEAIRVSLLNYSADQIARFDFALESAGGRVYDSSVGYEPPGVKLQLFGINLPISLSRNSPSAVIQVIMILLMEICF